VAEYSRLRRESACRDERVLGGGAVAVEAGEPVDGLADREVGNVGGDRDDHSGELVRRDRGQTVDGPLELVACERGGVDADERVTGPERRNLDLLESELVGAAGRVQTDRAHRRDARSRLCRSFGAHSDPPFPLQKESC
jgi:hypothetical protein